MDKKYRSLKDYFGVAARGFVMGAADVVPGVSGGTMAFILGIYEDLLHAIHSIDLHFIRNILTLRIRQAFAHFPWRFLLALGAGIGLAIFSLAGALSWALHEHPSLVWAFFFGLVVASVVVVRKRVQRWTPAVFLVVAVSAVLAYLLVGMVPVQTPESAWFLMLTGAVAICAMILPGISGAFILVLMGKYHFVLEAVVNRNFLPLLLVMAGAAVGIIAFARVLRWLFNHYHDITVAALIGLILGALRKVWPWKETLGAPAEGGFVQEINILPSAFTGEVALAIGLMVLGFLVVIGLEYAAGRQEGEGYPQNMDSVSEKHGERPVG